MKKILFFILFGFCIKSFAQNESSNLEDKICVVFVSDQKYLPKFYDTYKMLRTKGNYDGDVVLIITDKNLDKEIYRNRLFKNKEMSTNFYVKYLPKISVTEELKNNCLADWKCLGYMQKYHVFDTFFSSWDYVFYIDCGMHIYSDISRILNLREKDTILAHSDCYCSPWAGIQAAFVDDGSAEYQELKNTYDLSRDYFQSTAMLFDTNLIEVETKENLKFLMSKYQMGKSDQSYIALYFTQIEPKWKQIQLRDEQTWFYDFSNRHPGPYIMCKYPGACYKYLPDLDPNVNRKRKNKTF